MDYRLPDDLIKQFAPEDIVEMNAPADDCLCGCRSNFTVQDGLLNLHGRPIFDRVLISGDLLLPANAEIQRLPDLLAVTGTVNINDCSNLKVMPSKMYVGASIHMDRTNVRDLPATMVAVMSISMRECPNVLEIPEGTKANSLNAAGCSKLNSISAGLKFTGLDLSDTPISELPADLTVTNELKLRNCCRLGLIGEGVTAGTVIDVRGCDMLFTLPHSIQPNIAITDGMMLAYDRVVIPNLTGEDAGLCLGFKAIEAFPHRHFKNLHRMQDPVSAIEKDGKGSLKGRAVGVLKSDRGRRWQHDFFRRLVARLDESDTSVLTGAEQMKRLR